MIRRRSQKSTNVHFGLLVNKSATNYNRSAVSSLIGRIRKSGGRYTIMEPKNAGELLTAARQMAELEKPPKDITDATGRWGKISSLVACGGDGTANLVSRAAAEAGLPLGLYPMGRDNNIANSLIGGTDLKAAAEQIIRKKYRPIDYGIVADQNFLGSVGVGFIPELHSQLVERGRPRFSPGWKKIVGNALQRTSPRKLTLSIDQYRFEAEPAAVLVSLLRHSCGLELSPASLVDDGQAEVIFDATPGNDVLLEWVKESARQKYLYGSDVKLYRGRRISFDPADGMIMYLDGELVELPTRTVEVRIESRKLRVFG